MGVAAALAPVAAPAPRWPAPAPPVKVAQRCGHLLQRACDCGAVAAFSGRCESCDRTSLGHAGPASLQPPDVQRAAAVKPQTSLHMSSPGDAAEQEAQVVGRQVARMPDPAAAIHVLRGETGPPRVYRRATGQPDMHADTLSEIQSGGSSGVELPTRVRLFMEPRFGADFADVRIHVGERAATLAGRLGAQAFTVGRDVYFGRDQFQPDSPAGRELIAHELTHTIQQNGVLPRPPHPAAPAPAPPPAKAAAGMAPAATVPLVVPPVVPPVVPRAPPAAARVVPPPPPRVAAPAATVAKPPARPAPPHLPASVGHEEAAHSPVAAHAAAAAPAHTGSTQIAPAEMAHAVPAPAAPAVASAARVGAPGPHVAPAAPAVPAPATRVAARAPVSVQRLGISDAWNYFADKANIIPGFRMLTIVLGVNPLNMAPVDRSAANVLRAIVEFIPGGGIIVQALDNSGVFEKVGAWVSDQLATLKMTGSALKDAVTTFLGTLSWSDIFDLGGVWERAKRIFTEPIDRLIAFVKDLVVGILKFIKDAILLPLAKLAQGTRGWDLLIAVLGKNPITGEAVPQTAETLIAGFLKLIGQDEIWENMKKSNAIPRAWAWFKGAMAAVLAFVSQIPDLFVAAFKSLTIEDVVLVAGAFQKVASVFGGFIGKFIDWAGTAIWNLLEIIFDVVSPGALTYIKKTGAALKSILQNPLPFVGNLVKAAKLGFENFAAHFGEHLKTGLIDWLTGSLPGVYIPKTISLVEIGKFALSVLGITWAQIRGKIVKALGPTGETIMKALETTFDVVVALVKGGPAAAWELIKEKLSDLKDTVISGLTSFVMDTIVSKALPKLISLFVPGAGFISAILSIYDTVMVFVQKLAKIVAAVKAFVDSIVAIAAGQIEGAANKVESTLAGLLSLAISFLAGFLGLGNIADKIMGVIKKVQAAVDKALDTAIAWVITKAKALFAKLFGKKDEKPGATDALSITVPVQMSGVSHQLTTETGPTGLRIRMASRADYLLALIGRARKELGTRPSPISSKDQDLLKYLDTLESTLKDAEETRVASGDVGGAEGNAIRAGVYNKMIQISVVLASIGQEEKMPDLEHLSHPATRYVGQAIGPNQYELLDKTAKRKRFYPSGYSFDRDSWIKNKLTQSGTSAGKPGMWQDMIDKQYYPISVPATIDHKEPVAKHWNRTGRDAPQPARVVWYSEETNLQLATGPNNTSEGAKGEPDMVDDVGLQFTGPEPNQ